MKHHIRWMISRDWSEVMTIESSRYLVPWTEDDLRQRLRQRNVIGMVVEHQSGSVAGYMVYGLQSGFIELLNLAVHPDHDRQGFGTAMIDKLMSKLTNGKRNSIRLLVRESNLAAQLFFRSVGFAAVSIERDHYEDTHEDAYVMVRGLTQNASSPLSL